MPELTPPPPDAPPAQPLTRADAQREAFKLLQPGAKATLRAATSDLEASGYSREESDMILFYLNDEVNRIRRMIGLVGRL
jgi:hypothetical protein